MPVVRHVLACCGISAATARPVATLDDLGRPVEPAEPYGRRRGAIRSHGQRDPDGTSRDAASSPVIAELMPPLSPARARMDEGALSSESTADLDHLRAGRTARLSSAIAFAPWFRRGRHRRDRRAAARQRLSLIEPGSRYLGKRRHGRCGPRGDQRT